MNRFARAPLAALLLSFATPAFAQSPVVPAAPVVSNGWSRATAPGLPNGAAYVTISVSAPDQLVGASTPVAATAELHETTNDAGVMKMRPVPVLALAPGKPVTFAPGGYHIMLMGLRQPLQAGGSFPLTLRFKNAAPVTTTISVGRAGASAPPMTMPGTMPGAMPGAMPGMTHHDAKP